MIDTLGEVNTVTIIGIFGGVLLGLAARLGRFCTLGAIEDHFFGGSSKRLGMWGLAIGLSVIGSFTLLATGSVDITDSFYVSLKWAPISCAIGGLLFGYGMAIAGNCGYGAIARLGGGDLRSFVIVLVMGIATFFTLSGPLGPYRVEVFGAPVPALEPQSVPFWLASNIGIAPATIGILIGLAFCVASLSVKDLRDDKSALFWSAVVAIAVVSAWAGTGYVAREGFADLPTVSHTFASPIGEAVIYLMTSSGQSLSFALGSVAGVWLGAFIGSLIKGHFRWEACEDPRELRRQIFGAGLMGVGAGLALGCSIGQGLSAFSLLSFSAPLTLFFIVVGAWLGLTQLISGFSLSFASQK